MGGYSYLIDGELKNEFSEYFKSFKKGDKNNTVVPPYNEILKIRFRMDEKSVTIPEKSLAGLKDDYRDFIYRKIKNREDSTANFLEYICLDVIEVFLRGVHEFENDDVYFYIQLSFSGCAGLGEVSSALATHWAKVWYEENKFRLIKDYFDKIDFQPINIAKSFQEDFKFIPLARFGHALYSPNWYSQESDYSKIFRIDGDIEDHLRKKNKFTDFTSKLDSLKHIIDINGCCCKLCNPNFDDYEIKNVIESFI